MSIVASVQQLTKDYSMGASQVVVRALRGVDIDFREGQSVAICGQSGSGKSTMLNLLGCLDRPTSGRYFLGDVDVASLDDDAMSEIRGQRVGFVFQNFNLIQQLTVLENLEVPLFYQGIHALDRQTRAQRMIELVGLEDRGHHRPMELSGGQQQRVAIARALINDPIIVLADEPTGNLDTATGDIILKIFDQLHDQGRTIIMVTHEPHVAHRCDRIITLRDGVIVSEEQGSQGRTRTRASA